MKEEDLKLGRIYLNTIEIVSDVINKINSGERLTIVCGNNSFSFNTRDSADEINDANEKVVKQVLGILGEYQDKFTNLFKEL